MIEENFNTANGIVEVRWSGEFAMEDIFVYAKGLRKYRDKLSVLKILTKLEDVHVRPRPDIEILKKLGKEVGLMATEYDSVYDAFVVQSAMDTAFSTLYEKLSTNPNYFYRVFSEERIGRAWLQYS